jgi:hypothetical protein
MPVLGLLHILIAIYFAVHAVRNGQPLYWIVILFMFPAIGSVVYFFAIYLPQSRIDSGVRKAGAVIQRTLDPGRELREARAAFDLTPTAHNQMRLASALFEAGQVAEACEQYDACLRGPFAKDAEIGLGAAQARIANGQPQAAISLLRDVAVHHPTFRPEQVGLLLAKALDGAGQKDEAGAQFAAMAQRFNTIESHGERALWAIGNGERAAALEALKEVAHLRKHAAKYTLGLHADLLRRLDAASAGLI